MIATTAPFLTDYDLYLMGEGSHYRIYEKLGLMLVSTTARPERTLLSGLLMLIKYGVKTNVRLGKRREVSG
jgi:hypothetical protein